MAQRCDDEALNEMPSIEEPPPAAKSVALRRLYARRRLEDYWEEKRLRKQLDDFEDS